MRYYPANRLFAALFLTVLTACLCVLFKQGMKLNWALDSPDVTIFLYIACCQAFWLACGALSTKLTTTGYDDTGMDFMLGTVGLFVVLVRGLVHGYWDLPTPQQRSKT